MIASTLVARVDVGVSVVDEVGEIESEKVTKRKKKRRAAGQAVQVK